ncbi:hypothetical protein HYC85_017529 [Camellia sinensis]|uniref:Uncharacterized protein n=1 Tax=Camellia sinensis TaxID=4442 RepID=A0A7J7GRN7_CAMSI|nr:hypothetical protein HYC85_017529 [Camellia sinensis]
MLDDQNVPLSEGLSTRIKVLIRAARRSVLAGCGSKPTRPALMRLGKIGPATARDAVRGLCGRTLFLNNGFPFWLHFIPGIQFQTDNEPFKAEMKPFTAKIVYMVKQENSMLLKADPLSYPRLVP